MLFRGVRKELKLLTTCKGDPTAGLIGNTVEAAERTVETAELIRDNGNAVETAGLQMVIQIRGGWRCRCTSMMVILRKDVIPLFVSVMLREYRQGRREHRGRR